MDHEWTKKWILLSITEGKESSPVSRSYFAYVLSVELFFYLAISADLVSRDRPSNKIDFAYLYYLPFCRIFTSNDALHEHVVPLFLRADQTFVNGTELKEDFGGLDQHYSSLPKEG